MNKELTMKTIISLTMQKILYLMILVPLLSFPAFAGDLLYSLSAALGDDASMKVNFNVSSTSQLQENTNIEILMPNQQTVTGVVTRTIAGANRSLVGIPKNTSKTIISLVNNRGSLELITTNNTISGMILYDAINKKYYRAIIDSSGRGVLKKEDINIYQCADMPVAPDDSGIAAIPTADLIPSVAELQNLESKPGASKTLYLNYWGGTLTDTAWNSNYNSGNPIIYTPYSYDDDTTTFSSADRYRMWLGWQEAAEDYAAFDINITTKQSVYDATPIVNRSQMIATTTNYFYPGVGGVAYVGVFGNSADYYKTAWAWNSGTTSLGMTISHEAGHNMGLGHDGTSSLGYYSGHGVWGPIMGAPFGQKYVQWSKGDYPDANNTQNDLTIIGGVLGAVADDAGDTNATATALSLPVTDYEGQIRPNGLAADVDVYRLSLSGETHLEVKTLMGDEGESRAANLAMNVILKNSSGTVVASMTSSDTSPLDPTTNTLVYDGSLATGTYYLTIDAVSPDTSWATGFDEYDNEGIYRLTISTSSSTPGVAILVSPTGTISDATPTYTWNAVSNSSYYYLWVYDSTGSKITKWYSASDAGCSNGIGTCAVTPSTTLTNGAVYWWVQTWNDFGYGPLSNQGSFIVNASPPAKASLVSPSGTISDNTPTYIWNAVSNSSYYYLWVYDSTGSKITKWYSASDAGCSNGTGTCSITPSTTLANGAGYWWIQTWNSSGYGPLSNQGSFTINASSPAKASLVSPSGTISDNTPTYIWNAVSNSSYYYLWVYDSTGSKITKWYSASDAGCSNGTGTCSITPSTTLANGAGYWWIQTWNSYGYGPLSEQGSFTVQ